MIFLGAYVLGAHTYHFHTLPGYMAHFLYNDSVPRVVQVMINVKSNNQAIQFFKLFGKLGGCGLDRL